MRTNTCIVVALFATVLCTPAASAEQPLRGEGEAVPGSYIVVLKDGTGASPQALTTRYRGTLKRTYRASGLRIGPVVEAIMRHPALYARLDAPDRVLDTMLSGVGA
jgi:hypothetical protein